MAGFRARLLVGVVMGCCGLSRPAAAEEPVKAADGPLPVATAASQMTLPKGFKATLFAGEPDVVQPIAATLDDRGRLWVVECLSYPDWDTAPGKGRDRVVILEDQDGDGRFDKRTVFIDQASNLSGIALGFGGVWLCSTPNLVFVPDANRDDQPDGPAQVVLDGWDLKAKHNVFAALSWGPDGWLYGCNGIMSNSKVGKPGAVDAERVTINCGVWRFHPTERQFEAVAHGTTNPWGLDFDDYGEMFITNCVIAHLWHVVPGAHFQRMYGQDVNPYCFELMQSCADHLHWAGGPWTEARGGAKHHEAGGGHAHSGAMIYLGDSWPAEYRNHLFTCNIHGNRVNQDALERRGSGYVAHHAPDMLLANDPWFRGLALTYGPDGAAYVLDWTDTGECHNYKEVDRTNGRIYKVTYGDVRLWHDDLSKKTDTELAELQLHKNDWQVRHARRLLQERSAALGKAKVGSSAARQSLEKMLAQQPNSTRRLRALWTLHVTGQFQNELPKILDDADPRLRGWAIRLLVEDPSIRPQLPSSLQDKFREMAKDDSSSFVRLCLASALQRLASDKRWEIAGNLLSHGDDSSDANLPLMVWYGIEPLVAADPVRALELARQSKIPLVTTFIARRAISVAKAPEGQSPQISGTDALLATLAGAGNSSLQLNLLRGMEQALHGRRQVPMPSAWPEAFAKLSRSDQSDVRRSATGLTLIFGDKSAVAALRKLAADNGANTAERTWAIEALVQARDAGIVDTLQSLVTNAELASPAIRGLATFDQGQTPAIILRHFGRLAAADRINAASALCSRPAWAAELLKAVEHGDVPHTALTADQVRQLAGLGDSKIAAQVEKIWGAVRQSSDEKKALQEKFRAQLAPESLKSADTSHGRAVFVRVCANCHTLFDQGGKVGPDLTGSQRANLDYVLANVLDPSAVVAREYQLVIVQTDSGRVLNGIIKQEDDSTLTLQTTNELVTLTKDEIADRKQTSTSMMPEGLLTSLSDADVRDLVSYLASPTQRPLPAGENAGK
jgi:putative membrane-bound dehydrogenase-like protein